jgi:hypothetical protein
MKFIPPIRPSGNAPFLADDRRRGQVDVRSVAARVPVTGARVKQPDGIHGEHRGTRRDEQRQRDEVRANRNTRQNAGTFLAGVGGDLDRLCFHRILAELIESAIRLGICMNAHGSVFQLRHLYQRQRS